MSLGLPGEVIRISGATAVIDCWGTTRDVRLDPFAEVRVGDFAMAMGNPFVLAEDQRPTVTLGLVSGIERYQPGAGF